MTPSPSSMTCSGSAARMLPHQEDPEGVDEYSKDGCLPEGRPKAPLRTYHDAARVLELVDAFFFGSWAHKEIDALNGAEQINSCTDLLEITMEGTDERSISMVIHLPPE